MRYGDLETGEKLLRVYEEAKANHAANPLDGGLALALDAAKVALFDYTETHMESLLRLAKDSTGWR